MWPSRIPKNFTAPVRTKVETNDGITIFNGGQWNSIFHDHRRQDEFISNISGIGTLYGFCCTGSFTTLAMNQGIISKFYPFPTVVTVHGKITAADCCNTAGGLRQMIFKFVYKG